MTRYEVLHSVLQKCSRETSSLTKKHPASDIHEKSIAISTVIGKQLAVLQHSVEFLCLPTCSSRPWDQEGVSVKKIKIISLSVRLGVTLQRKRHVS